MEAWFYIPAPSAQSTCPLGVSPGQYFGPMFGGVEGARMGGVAAQRTVASAYAAADKAAKADRWGRK